MPEASGTGLAGMTSRTLALAFAVALSAACTQATAQEPDGGGLLHLRFSPDGRYVLAQSASSVTVLTVQPFRELFSAPAEGATRAEFTPDSRELVFVISGTRADFRQVSYSSKPPRVEFWSVAGKTRTASTEMPLNNCERMQTSPDGRNFVCLDMKGTLSVVDVASGAVVLRKEKFGQKFAGLIINDINGISFEQAQTNPGAASMAFSGDGRFLVAIPGSGDGTPFIWDFHKRKRLSLRGGLRDLQIGTYIAFVAPDRLAISMGMYLGESVARGKLVAFPSGRILSKLKLYPGLLSRASNPDFVIITSFEPPRRCAAEEYATTQAIITPTPVIDVFGDRYVAEVHPGEVGLYARRKGLQASINLNQK